jgi:hypothetical protein
MRAPCSFASVAISRGVISCGLAFTSGSRSACEVKKFWQ